MQLFPLSVESRLGLQLQLMPGRLAEQLEAPHVPPYRAPANNFGHWIPQWDAPNGMERKRLQEAFLGGDGVPAQVRRSFAQHRLGQGPLPQPASPPPDKPPTMEQIVMAQEAYPQYDIRGPGKYLIAAGQSGLYGAKQRLIATRLGVWSIEEAASACDHTPGCTQFSVTVGPSDEPVPWETWKAMPGRVLLLGGSMASVDDVEGELGKYAFVGIRRGKAAESPYDLDLGAGPFPLGGAGQLVPSPAVQSPEPLMPKLPDFSKRKQLMPGVPAMGPKSGGTGWGGGPSADDEGPRPAAAQPVKEVHEVQKHPYRRPALHPMPNRMVKVSQSAMPGPEPWHLLSWPEPSGQACWMPGGQPSMASETWRSFL